jgi:uridine phosphorylase
MIQTDEVDDALPFRVTIGNQITDRELLGEKSMWCLSSDKTEPIIKARNQINSAHRECHLHLPETAIVFFMSKGIEYLCDNHNAQELPEPFPRFLNRCPVWEIAEYRVCFLDGGRGAPQACDTVETLAALGVKNIISVGMFGAFDPQIKIGEIITPDKAFVEEGTSLHYYESLEYSIPSIRLHKIASSKMHIKTYPIVSTDAVYRQTFYKEQLWREKGAVGVDMETSVVFSVSSFLGLNSVGLLMASDVHPLNPDDPKWDWHMTREMRYELSEKSLAVAKQLSND